ncbi:MAG: hypothetical protein A2759_03740 [Candidatus Taylorbacteria bacterium RIFCSPHIGHO2_01_FULL_49_60]|nr:MAG: hypothetical protein A2759_03740 [Candidatus Taylorbacteria bacterium RIFCSPHIGHO2_01_FULL_49_60]
MRKILIFNVCLLAVIGALAAIKAPAVYAAQTENYVPLAPIDVTGSEFTSTGPTAECRAPGCLPRYLRTIYNVGIVLAGLFAVVSIVRGGFELMFTDSILGRMEGKGIILRALGGLLIVYSSYIFMNAINPGLGRDLDLALQFPSVTIKPCRELTSTEKANRPDCGELAVYTTAEIEARTNTNEIIKRVTGTLKQAEGLREKARSTLQDAKLDVPGQDGTAESLGSDPDGDIQRLRDLAAKLETTEEERKKILESMRYIANAREIGKSNTASENINNRLGVGITALTKAPLSYKKAEEQLQGIKDVAQFHIESLNRVGLNEKAKQIEAERDIALKTLETKMKEYRDSLNEYSPI